MLSKPSCGWTKVKIGSFEGNASYLTDVPNDLITCFDLYFQNGSSTCLFDEEGSDFVLVLAGHSSYVIVRRETEILIDLDITPSVLAKEFFEDLSKYKQDWIEWNPEAEFWNEETKKIASEKFEIRYLDFMVLLRNKGA